MNKKIVQYFIFICTIILSSKLHAQDDWQAPSDASSTFITIGVHGYPPSVSNTDHGEFGIDVSPYEGGSLSAGTTFKVWDRDLRNNVFAYTLSSNPNVLSETYVQEIGDFNNGSRRIGYTHPQCHISLSKCEWVYRQVIGADEKFGEYFFDILTSPLLTYINLLISPEYISLKLNDPQLSDAIGKITYKDQNGNYLTYDEDGDGNPDFSITDISTLARALYDAAWECPNTIRFVTHSMGGMFVLRYLAEEEPVGEWYYEDAYNDFSVRSADNEVDYVPGYYRRYQDYTGVEFFKDFELPTKNYDYLITNIQELMAANDGHTKIAEVEITSSDRGTIRNALYPVFKFGFLIFPVLWNLSSYPEGGAYA